MLTITERPAADGTPHRLPGTRCHRHHRPKPARAAAAHRSHDCVSDSLKQGCIENIPWRWTKPGAGAPRAAFTRWSVGTIKRGTNHFADLSLSYRGHGPLQRHQSSSVGAGRARDVRVDTRVLCRGARSSGRLRRRMHPQTPHQRKTASPAAGAGHAGDDALGNLPHVTCIP